MKILHRFAYTDKNYPTVCGSRVGICPLCGEKSYIKPYLLSGCDDQVVREYCDMCGKISKPGHYTL